MNLEKVSKIMTFWAPFVMGMIYGGFGIYHEDSASIGLFLVWMWLFNNKQKDKE